MIRFSHRLAISAFLSLRLVTSAATNVIGAALPPEVPINKDAGRGGLSLVTIRLESGQEAPFILDTGSTSTFLDKSFEPLLGTARGQGKADSWGKTIEVKTYAAPNLYIGDVRLITASNVTTWDFRSDSSSGRKPLGLLGFDCLKHYCIQLDFEGGKMRFLDSTHLETNGLGKAFPITTSRGGGRPFIYHVNLAGVPSTNELTDPNFLSRRGGMPGTYALLDTGFSGDGRIGKGSVQGHDSGRVSISQCIWEDWTYTNLVVGVEEQANLLGLRFLARHLVTLDFPNKTLYLKQTRAGPLD